MNKNTNLSPNVCKMQYVFLEDTFNIIMGTTHHSRKVIFKPGKAWLDLYHTPGTINFDQEQQSSPAGTYYNQKLILFYPGLDTANLSGLYNWDNKPILLKLTYRSGDAYLVGSKENPVSFNENFGTANGGSDFTYQRKSVDKAQLLET